MCLAFNKTFSNFAAELMSGFGAPLGTAMPMLEFTKALCEFGST
jgi:hypothetical protein